LSVFLSLRVFGGVTFGTSTSDRKELRCIGQLKAQVGACRTGFSCVR